ncbi:MULTISPECIES: glycoside hydrolase family 2 TIM barrel-domain containing protein [Acidobacteriaceae]|uniref:glycoside hydrolase family 2 TIM barrel-domain containing protein n=1 Tax=Acidobacteriaceae TaxID=204434 RepID=UPI00131C8D3D|nr:MULTISPECIES: glycoside hydrolase family 2 TIM barrel-domain containing protein [Acidobacteriaceae]MDW5265448.1 glycoside hydrolase family 2 TIM barrel-domain containing protein [Edaphobacter sp.]
MQRTHRLMVLTALATLALSTASMRAAQPRSPRQQLNADANWKFLLGDPAGAEAPSFADANWRSVTLPHDWSIEQAPNEKNLTGSGGGYFPAGIGWYRRTFTAPASWKGKEVSVEFDGVASNATIYLNGKKLGIHPYEYTSFRFDLTHDLDFSKANVLAVRVDDSEQPSSRWYSGSGIYRHVRVVVTEPLHVAPWGVFVGTPEATDASASVLVQTRLQNDSASAGSATVRTTLLSAAGQPVAKEESQVQVGAGSHEEATQKIALASPALWSPATPTLYRAVTELVLAGKVVDRVETSFGVRSLSWSVDKGLLLNGRSIKLVGGSVHHDDNVLGAASFDRAEERKVELLKAAGFNAVRTAHNPPSPAFLDACDRLGLLVLDEPFDVWTKSKVKYDYARFFNDWWQRDIDSMVLRDRNHPSIIMWGIGNEIPEAWTPKGGPIAKELADRVRSLDATRPLTEAFPGATYTPSTDAVMSHLDIGGYNYNLKQNQAKDHERVPSRIMVTTESLSSAAFDNWKLTQEHPYILGEFVWTAMDYLGESGIGSWSYVTPEEAGQVDKVAAMMGQMMANMGADGKDPFEAMAKPKDAKPDPMMKLMFPGFPWHAADSGDIDLTGYRKPQSYYRDILWNGGDRVFATVRLPEPEGKKIVAIGWAVYPTLPSWTWPGQDGKEMQVEVYAGTEKVRLYLNDKLVGEKPTGVEQERRALFTVPYAPGTLKAVGVNGDREVTTDVLQTVGDPVKVRLTADRKVLHADGEDLSYVTVEALDAQGRLQPNAASEAAFTISGPGTILAVGNGDGTSTEAYQGNHRALFHGRALVVVRTSRTAGEIRLGASAGGMTSDEIGIRAEPGSLGTELR